MNIITFGTDEHMLDQNSRQHARLLTYVDMADSYTAIIFSKKQNFEVVEKGTLTLIQVPKRFFLWQLRNVYVYLKTHKKERTVISSQDPFEVGIIGYICAKLLRYPFHVQIHTAIQSTIAQTESVRSRVQYYMFLFLLKRVDAFRVVSKGIRNFLIKKGVDERKIFLSPVIETLPEGVKERMYTGGTIEILCVARFVYFKNLPALIDAFHKFTKEHNAHLTIVGGGPLRKQLERKIFWHGLKDNVTLLDWVPNVMDLYKQADLYIHPSYYEGFGMAIVEALHFGVPVLATPDVGSIDYITKENGYIMSGYLPSQLLQGMEYAVRNLIYLKPDHIANSLRVISKAENDMIQRNSLVYAVDHYTYEK